MATYTVQPGDSLSLISKKVYGDYSMVDALVLVNKITNKDLITPGQVLITPDVEDAQVIEESSKGSGNKKVGKYIFLGLLLVGSVIAYREYKKRKPKLSGVKKKRKNKK
jgi:LysM repeat protein